MNTVTHIAGQHLRFGDTVRQRCAWCGDLLVTYTADMTELRTWAQGTIVSISEGATWQQRSNWSVPEDACFKDRRLDANDFDQYCLENKVPLGKEPEAFDAWLKEKWWQET